MRRIRLGAHVWWDAVSSGAFFTRYSLALSLVLALTVMAPFRHSAGEDDHLGVLLVGFLGWALLATLLVTAASAERRLRTRRSRAAVVLGAVVAAAIARPFVHEGLFVGLYDATPVTYDLPARISSNIIVWVAGLSIIAMTTRSVELTRGTRARLAHAVATLTHGRQRLARFENDNRAVLDDLVGDLRIRRDAMLAGSIDFEAVRSYSEAVRSASHRLEERAQLNLRLIDAVQPPAIDEVVEVSAFSLLRPPPFFVVGVVFLAVALPYAHGSGGLATVLVALLVGLPVTLAADLASRVIAKGRSAGARGVVIVSAWFAAGAVMTTLAQVLLPEDDPSKLMPLVSLPLLGIALAACTDAVARASTSSQRLEAVLGLVARTLTAKTAQARRPLRHAAHVLHGRVQGRCVMLAAHADEWELTEERIDTFRSDLDDAFDSVLWFEAEDDALGREGLLQSNDEDVAELVATWSSVLDVSTEVSPEAADALSDASVSRRVATVVNEGFVNAVKHSEARCVWLSISLDQDWLVVRTWSVGVLEKTSVGKPSSRGIGVLGPGARIYQRDDHVVLEVRVPLEAPAATAPVRTITRRRRAAVFRKVSSPTG